MELGQVVSGKYRLLRLLGDGGMGAVYEAHHETLGLKVAIKVLHDDLVVKPEIVDRFLQEARVLARISNPHVVRVLDLAVGGGPEPAYIVMELLVGEPLSALLRRERKVPIARAVDYATQVLDALAAAHALQVVHRDLKPENIFLTKEGDKTLLKVIDFGIAKARSLGGVSANMTVSGALMGTPEYMAPEQAHSADRADARSDLFAVGVLLYEMISGARPVDGEDPRLVAMKVERGDVHPLIHRVPEVPRELAGLVHRAMAPRPELRFASASEMKGALLAATAASHASGPPPSVAQAAPSPSATQSAPPPRASWMPPAVSSGTGTIVGGSPDGQGPSPFAGETDPGEVLRAGGGSGRPPAVASPEPFGPAPPRPYGQPPRGGRRGSGATLWMVGTLVLLIAGGVALAFAFTGSPKKPPVATPRTPAAPTDSAPPALEPSSSEVAIDTSIPPLPAGPKGPAKAMAGPATRGQGSAGPPLGPSASPSASTAGLPPFGLPPIFPNLLPSGLPNPFPTGSGGGSVLTIPTAFPDFGFPANPSAPPAASSGAPRRSPPH